MNKFPPCNIYKFFNSELTINCSILVLPICFSGFGCNFPPSLLYDLITPSESPVIIKE